MISAGAFRRDRVQCARVDYVPRDVHVTCKCSSVQVGSDIQSVTTEVEYPAKKPCLQPASCDNQDSHHSQALPGKDRLGSREMGPSEASPMQQHGVPLRSNRDALQPPGAAPDDVPHMLTCDGEPDATASDERIAQAEGKASRLGCPAFP